MKPREFFFSFKSKRGFSIAEILVGAAMASLLALVISQLFVTNEQIRILDDNQNDLATLNSFIGLALNPQSGATTGTPTCDQTFGPLTIRRSGTTVNLEPGQFVDLFLGNGPGAPFLKDPSSPSPAPSVFGRWSVLSIDLEIRSCRTLQPIPQDCATAPIGGLVTFGAEFVGHVVVTVQARNASGGLVQKVNRFPVRFFDPTGPAAVTLPADLLYDINGCSGTSAGGPPITNLDEQLCNKACFQGNVATPAFQATCWNSGSQTCDLSLQICDALNTTFPTCTWDEIKQDVLFTGTPCASSTPLASKGKPLETTTTSPNQNCRNVGSAPAPCPSCSVLSPTNRCTTLVCQPGQKKWVNFDAFEVGTCSCAAPTTPSFCSGSISDVNGNYSGAECSNLPGNIPL